jgi:hypothetical protein
MLRLFLFLSLVFFPNVVAFASQQDDEAKRFYQSGLDLLRAGNNLNKAIERLETAVRREPGNADYRSALACAYASRFASVAVAAKQSEAFENLSSGHRFLMKEWTEGQKDPTNRLFGLPEPVAPPSPATLDDGQVFTLDGPATRKELLRLGHRAVDGFDRARELAGDRPKADRARLEYARGWGLFSLRHFGEGWVMDVRPAGQENANRTETGPLAIPPADVVDSFRRCISMDSDGPDLVDYEYSLALAHAPKLLSWYAGLAGAREELSHSSEEIKAAGAVLEKILARKPEHRDAVYAAGLLFLETEPKKGAEYLEKTAHMRSGNAVAWYQAAEARFRQAEDEDKEEAARTTRLALKITERGNRAPRYHANRVGIPVPKLLRKAWEAVEAYGLPDGYLAANFGARLMVTARDAAKRAALDDAAAAYRLECGFGAKVLSALDSTDLDVRLPRTRHIPQLRRQFGALHFMVGYQGLEEIHRQQPDPTLAQFLALNREAFERAKVLERTSY